MATMIQAVDDGVGRLIAKLEALELLDNTVILFSSDNGGYGPATDMDPLWGYKGTYYEGGIRVPFFVNWPGVVQAGETRVPITGVDIYPTLLSIAGAERPDQALDGVDLVPLFKREVADLDERPLFWHFPAYLQSYKVTHEQRDPLFRTRPCSVIRKGRFKLHEYFEDGGLELYDLVDDIRERKNLADENPEKRDELHRLLKEWREEIGAPVPERN
jgi:arylsulfatase A-like enzyme